MTITGNLVDVHQKKIYPADIIVQNGNIISIKAIHNSLPMAIGITFHHSKALLLRSFLHHV